MKNLLLSAALTVSVACPVHAACLDVVVQGSQNGQNILVGLYGEDQPFPRPGEHLTNQQAEMADGSVSMRFKGLMPNAYALAIAVDENKNGVLDTGLFGIPTEPVAFSSDARSGLFGPPRFTAAAFDVAESNECHRETILLQG